METTAVGTGQPAVIDNGKASVPVVTQSEKENRIQTEEGSSQASQDHTKQLCRFYSQGRRCHYGKRCHFLHQKAAPSEALMGLENSPDTRDGFKDEERKNDALSLGPHQQSVACCVSEKEFPSNPRTTLVKQTRDQRLCRYFMSGFCSMDDRCRFWHPQQVPLVEDQCIGHRERSSGRTRPLVMRPPVVQEQVKLADLTEEMSGRLRETEISQLMKRFPKDKLIVQDREDGQLTYYRVTVEASDPEWPYDLKEMDIMVSFPESYPQEVFTVEVPTDQHLPSVMGRHIQLASQEWLQAKHATSELMGKVELLFRPYLRWLDRSMERLFTEGARQVTSDLNLSGRLTCTAQCEKCGAGISATFRPSMLHHYSDVLGYLDLNAAVPVDLVLQDCKLIVGCLSCNKEDTFERLSYGQNKETSCQHCHSKLNIFVEATQFQYIQPKTRNQTESAVYNQRNIRNPAVQQGKPLPEKGTCKHFKQSHRWLRFPCCGRAYPCDVCHDEDQDHVMELATRMICGYCAKEQPYGNGKPCVVCGGMMTRGSHTSHWEGGLGCRSKVKMNRNDRQKYANTCKTVSRKANSEKK